MKYILIISMSLALNLTAQIQHDFNWFVGVRENSAPVDGITKLDFNNDTLVLGEVISTNEGVRFKNTNACVSDASGKTMFLTDGKRIYDAELKLMANGDSINFGYLYPFFSGYVVPQGALILPFPDNADLYRVFHVYADYHPIITGAAFKLMYSDVDMTLQNGLGEVIQKNQTIIADTIGYGKLTATRHANGQDWWFVIQELESDKYYIFLFDENGVFLHHEQHIGPQREIRDWSGQAVFSPDGSKYIVSDPFNQLDIFDFNRCTGKLYNARHIDLGLDESSVSGVSVSPNSRYLYISALTKLYQFDLLAADIAASKVTVGEYDGFENPFPTTFYLMQLAPNGKIYMCYTNGGRSMHFISQPDSAGLACDFRQHALSLPTSNTYTIPNFPFFRLGATAAGYCDSLLLPTYSYDNQALIQWNLFPNPTLGETTLSFEEPFSGLIRIVSTDGKEVYRKHISEVTTSTKLDIQDLSPGIFVCVLAQKNAVTWRRFVVL